MSVDDRFVAKELSKAELQTMETFAPAYFDYMSSAVAANVSIFAVLAGRQIFYESHSFSDLLYWLKSLVATN